MPNLPLKHCPKRGAFAFHPSMPQMRSHLYVRCFLVRRACRHTDNQGLSLRKRFRATSRHTKGKGLVISVQTIAGHTLFSCTVGDLGHLSGIGDVSLDSWSCIEGMVNVVRRTGHSSFYVEKGMSAMGKTAKQMGIQGEFRVNGGGMSFTVRRHLTTADAKR